MPKESTRLLNRLKPAASASTHLLAAAMLWSLVGSGLLVAGAHWCWVANHWWPYVLVALGVGLGFVKGRMVLEKSASKSVARILRRGDSKCIGGFFSWITWVFVLCMMGLGAFLRHSHLPREILGVLYTAIGAALLWGSQVFWRAWSRY